MRMKAMPPRNGATHLSDGHTADHLGDRDVLLLFAPRPVPDSPWLNPGSHCARYSVRRHYGDRHAVRLRHKSDAGRRIREQISPAILAVATFLIGFAVLLLCTVE